MTITDPAAIGKFQSDWTSALTRLANGLLQSQTVFQSGSLSLTTSTQNIPGCEITFTTTGANSVIQVTGCCQFGIGTSSANNSMELRVALDGVYLDAGDYVPIGVLKDQGSNGGGTLTIGGVAPVAAGSHTLDLAALKTGTGVYTTAANTSLSVLIFDLA